MIEDIPLPGFGHCELCDKKDAKIADLRTKLIEHQRELARWRGDYGSLYNGAPPRVHGSPTSAAGAAKIAPKAGQIRQQILQHFQQDSHGRGLTCAEVELLFPDHSHQSISARIRELVLEGDIYNTGETRVNPKSGVKVRVYREVKETADV